VPAVAVGRMRGKRVILNYRGGEAGRFFRHWGWAVRPFFRLSDVVTTPSEFLAGVIRKHFRIPVRIVPNILDLGAFVHRSRKSFQPKMLVTRHLEPIYDVESVLRAFRQVQVRHPEASLWIAGTGSQQERLRGLVSAWGLANVRFLGHIPHSDLPKIYDQCDILLNASLVDNFPGALIEASGAGLAVISTAAGGIPYIYENGRTALLVEPGNWEALAGAVQKVLEFPSLASDMVKAAEVMARACDWKEVRKHLYHAYGFPLDDQPKAAGEGVQCAAG
jgi:glycosyltransferase involved in cell wall biosynthesis